MQNDINHTACWVNDSFGQRLIVTFGGTFNLEDYEKEYGCDR